jgi:hypothetical protein
LQWPVFVHFCPGSYLNLLSLGFMPTLHVTCPHDQAHFQTYPLQMWRCRQHISPKCLGPSTNYMASQPRGFCILWNKFHFCSSDNRNSRANTLQYING